MAIDTHYIPAFTLETVFLDKDTGAPLSGGIITFERSLQPGTLKPVYQITGDDPDFTYTQLPNPMILSSIGTFEDSLGNPVVPYFFPFNADFDPDYYRVIVQSSGLVEQFVRDPVPYIASAGIDNFSSAFDNEISNPQFAEVLFDTSTPDYVYSFDTVSNEVVALGPDWDLVVTSPGIGTVTVTQVTPTGDLNILTNPGTILEINSAGLSSLKLRQRIFGSPNLWGHGYISASLVGKTFGGTATTVTMLYSQSNGAVMDIPIVTANFSGDGNYAAFPDSTLIDISTSTEFFPDSYIDIELDIPVGVHIALTSIMLSPTGDVSIEDIIYSQESQNRQIDHLFHYYQPQINYKAIPSLLTGWDFPLNPAQFGSTGNISAVFTYIWDQTIAARGATNIAYARNSVTSGIQFTTAGATDAFMICQYLSGVEAKKILGTKLSVNLNAYRGSAGGAITYRIYLFRGSSAAVIPTLTNLIGGLDTNGEFNKNNTAGQGLNWTYIERGNQSDDTGVATGNLSTVTTNDQIDSSDNDYGFNGWEITDATEIGNTNKFCIIVTFQYAAASTVVTVNSVSLVPGDIPSRPGAKTLSETVLDCQYYYQKSFPYGTTPAQNTGANSGESYGIQVGGAGASAIGPIISFPVGMRAAPDVTLYNPSAANAQIKNTSTGIDWSGSSATSITTQGFIAIGTTDGGSVAGNGSSVHWAADGRLGIV